MVRSANIRFDPDVVEVEIERGRDPAVHFIRRGGGAVFNAGEDLGGDASLDRETGNRQAAMLAPDADLVLAVEDAAKHGVGDELLLASGDAMHNPTRSLGVRGILRAFVDTLILGHGASPRAGCCGPMPRPGTRHHGGKRPYHGLGRPAEGGAAGPFHLSHYSPAENRPDVNAPRHRYPAATYANHRMTPHLSPRHTPTPPPPGA